ncbi:MAG: S9 family peptidase, partial [Caulobacteraceae bacterium]|nr:S9 family peptidase [Caulobacter sp.]
ACAYAGLAFSPDGAGLAFVATDRSTGVASLEVARGGVTRVVATVKGSASTPRWSPDGRTLALLATPGARKQAGAVQAGVPLVGEIGVRSDEQRLAVVPAAGGELRFVSPADTYVYEYGWTPDGRGFAATSAKGDGDDNWWVAKLVAYTVDGAPERVIAAPKLQMNFPRVSPDGRQVIFVGGLMSDFGSVGGDLYTVPLGGGEPRDITPGFRGTFTSVSWTGARPVATALIVDHDALAEIDSAGGAPRIAWSQPVTLTAGDGRAVFSADSAQVAFVAQDYTHAPHVMVGPLSAPRAVTHDNDALPAHVRARSLTWRSDNFEVQGWLVEPLTPSAGPRPMMVEVHGGPAAAATPTYVSAARLEGVLGHGYAMLEPNPRGSYGQGETFTRANVRDFGGGDLRDILAGVDAAVATGGIDAKRVGVMGVSYGGFMTLYAATHSDRFKAGVAGAGIADWYSYYGQNGIHQWMLPFFGASAYDDPQLYLRLSPIWTIKQAKTPTFIWVGERDIECPPAQSIELFNGLREMHVPTSLVIYPDEGHGVRQPEHVQDVNRRTLEWLDRYMR